MDTKALRHGLAVALASTLALTACGGGGGDDAAPVTTEGEAAGTTTTAATASTGSVEVGETAWFAGFEITVGTATVTPATDELGSSATLDIDVDLLNTGADSAVLDATLVVESGGTSYEASDFAEPLPQVPGEAKGKGTLSFLIDEEFSLDDAVLTIGRPDNNQAVVPIGGEGELVTLEPQPITVTGSASAGPLQIDVDGGELRYDVPATHDQVEEGKAAVTIDLDATFNSDFAGGYALTDANIALTLPDGTTVAQDEGPIELLRARTTLPDLFVRFLVDNPAEGEYQVVITDDTDPARPKATITFTI